MIYFLILRKKNSRYFNFNYALYLFFIMNIIALYLTLHKISIDDLSISSIPISRRSSRSRKYVSKWEMALRRRRKEGRKRATRPSHTCHLSFLAIEQREITKDGGGGGRRKGARNHAEKPGKGGQLEPSHYNDWLSLQKQTPHLLCSLLPQLPAVIIRLCVCEHALVSEYKYGYQYICAIRA